jgi:hypothetical protein
MMFYTNYFKSLPEIETMTDIVQILGDVKRMISVTMSQLFLWIQNIMLGICIVE